jgi:hypothetical protein
MSELKHWLDESSEADDFERDILRAGLEADPPEARRDQVWAGLMGALAGLPPTATTSAQTAGAQTTGAQTAGTQTAGAHTAAVGVSKVGAVGLAVAKGFLVGVAIYCTAAGVTELSERLSARPAHAPTAHRATLPAGAAPRVIQPLTSATAAGTPLARVSETAPSPAQETVSRIPSANALAREPAAPALELRSVGTFDPVQHASSARLSQLEAETSALRRARDELRAGKLTDAFATLEASRRQFAVAELYQEREALMIELLARSGKAAAAEQRARAFLSRFPESPHAQQIQRFTRK